MRKWRIEDSEELYNITGWGTSYFSINDAGHVVVTPRRDGVTVDLKELVDELQLRDVASPMLLRFPDILDNRIEKMSSCFKQAAEEYASCGRRDYQPRKEIQSRTGSRFQTGTSCGDCRQYGF